MSSPQDPNTDPAPRRRKLPVEGGGPIGCGCGSILGFFLGLILLADGGWWLVAAVAIVSGVLGWKFGDSYFEKVLSGGDPEGKPVRYWHFW